MTNLFGILFALKNELSQTTEFGDLDGQGVRSPTKLKKQSVNYKKDIQKVNAKRKITQKNYSNELNLHFDSSSGGKFSQQNAAQVFR